MAKAAKKREFFLIDGYNIIFAWETLKTIANASLENARVNLLETLSNYGGMTHSEIIVVFDAHKVTNGVGMVQQYGNIKVVYTKEAQTADEYIERTVVGLVKKYKVKVATSDNLENLIIVGHGAQRVSATDLLYEIEANKKHIREKYINNRPIKNNMLLDNLDPKTAALLEQMRRQKGTDKSGG